MKPVTLEAIAKHFDDLAAMEAAKRGLKGSDKKVAADNHRMWFVAAAALVRSKA